MRWTVWSTVFLTWVAMFSIMTLGFGLTGHSMAIVFAFILAGSIGLLIGSMREPFPGVDTCPECGHPEEVHAIDKEPMDPYATVFCMANLGVGTASAGQCRCER